MQKGSITGDHITCHHGGPQAHTNKDIFGGNHYHMSLSCLHFCVNVFPNFTQAVSIQWIQHIREIKENWATLSKTLLQEMRLGIEKSAQTEFTFNAEMFKG